MRLLLAGGGTGGHLVPGLAVADEVRRRGGEVLFLTAGRPVEARILGGAPSRALPLESGRGAPGPWATAARIPGAIAAARQAIAAFRPHALLGLGGLASFPAALAALRADVPVALLEINAVPGRATRWLRPLAQAIFVAFEPAARAVGRKARLTGAPLRRGFAELPGKDRARETLGLDRDAPVLLVLGGSQGSEAVNRAACSLFPWLAERGVQLLWVCGPGRAAACEDACRGVPTLRTRVFEYVDDAAALYAASDGALARTGGGTVAELAAARLPVVALPYPHHRDRQQYWNARQLGEGAIVLEERGLNRRQLEAALDSIFGDETRRLALSQACARVARPRATPDLVDALEALGARARSTPLTRTPATPITAE